MKLLKRRISIATRVGGSLVGVVTLVALFIVAYFPTVQHHTALEALKTKATVVVSMASAEITPAIDFDDLEVIRESMKGMALDGDFVFAALYDSNGKLMATERSNTEAGRQAQGWIAGIRTKPLTAPWLIERKGSLEVHYPVSTPGAKKATLVAGFSLDRLAEDAENSARTTFVVALAILVVGLVAAYLLGRSIGHRVQRVVEAAQRTAKGEISASMIVDEVEDEIGDIVQSFNAMNANLHRLTERVAQVANGDLSQTAGVEGDLAQAFNRMVINQRELVSQISTTATQLNGAAGQFFSNAQQQARGATDQSVAVSEVRRTLEVLSASAREIGTTAEDVLKSAEHSQKNSVNVAEKIAALSNQTRSIAEILEVIKDIANKSELLALNAGLEGTKAGEAGRGFSLVASQMQRLAEKVMGAVRDIKELTTTITESTQATVLATEESTKLASDTTRSAQQIGLTIQQQRSRTDQAVSAMVAVGEVATQTATGSKEIVQSATDLMELSERLQALVGRFRVGGTQTNSDRVMNLRDAAE